MLPVMGHPAVVEESADFFRSIFSWHQFKRFKQYLTGLITGRNPSVRSIALRQVEAVDQSTLNRFLTTYDWSREELNRTRLQLLQTEKATRWKRDGVIAIDDTLLPKTGKKMPGAGKLWDHAAGRYVHAQCLVTSHYADPDRDYPVGLRQYFKHDSPEADKYGFRTKIMQAMELVDECEELGVPAGNYVFDSWYLSGELAGHIEAYGKGWVSRLKRSRILHTPDGKVKAGEWERRVPRHAFRKVEALDRSYWVYTEVLNVNRLGRLRVVASYDNPDLEGEPVILASSRTHWRAKSVVRCYGLRFRVDNFYRDAKQNLGLGGCHLRTLKGAGSHRLLGFTGYSLLKIRVCRSKLYRRLRSDQTIGAECRRAFMDLLQNLIQWVYVNANKLQVNQILDVILR